MRTFSSLLSLGSGLLWLTAVTGCDASGKGGVDSAGGTGSGTDGDSGEVSGTTPTVTSTAPLDGSIDAALNLSATASFSEDMDAGTLTPSTFTLATVASSAPVSGTVITDATTATFWPSVHLADGTEYVATIAVGASSAAGMPLAAAHSWTFTTGTTLGPGQPVHLGEAGNFAILAKAGISSVPASSIVGDLGVSPAAATYITGFSLTADATNTFSTSPQVTGMIFASDYSEPTPTYLTTAIGDMERAFVDAAGRAPGVTELGAGNIGGMTLPPGVYRWSSGVLIPTDLTLDGGPTDVWVFQISQDLTVSSGAQVVLAGGAETSNIFWQVAGRVEMGTTSHLEGNVVTSTAINLRTGASLNGRLLAQTAVDLDGGVVTAP